MCFRCKMWVWQRGPLNATWQRIIPDANQWFTSVESRIATVKRPKDKFINTLLLFYLGSRPSSIVAILISYASSHRSGSLQDKLHAKCCLITKERRFSSAFRNVCGKKRSASKLLTPSSVYRICPISATVIQVNYLILLRSCELYLHHTSLTNHKVQEFPSDRMQVHAHTHTHNFSSETWRKHRTWDKYE
jgi:hypothetical protein